MANPNHAPVTETELIARIDRRLAPNGQALCRKPTGAAPDKEASGRYDLIELATNHLVRQDVNLEALAREIGALAEHERFGT